jgi:hypothetical protein
LWRCHTGDHPPRDLATFGFRPAMKVENLLNLPGYLLEQCAETWRIFRKFLDFRSFFRKGNISWQKFYFGKKIRHKFFWNAGFHIGIWQAVSPASLQCPFLGFFFPNFVL